MAESSWSKNPSANASTQKAWTKTTTTAPSTTTSTTSGGNSQTVNEVISQQNMTPENLAQLNVLIQALMSGGTNEIKASKAKREQTTKLVEQLLGQVSTGQAMEDAKALMALNLQQAMERNMPAIQRAIEGAGTSASSMQALLSQQAARDAALAAGALGAQQAQVYAAQRSNLANTLEALTRPDNQATEALIRALGVAKGAVTNTQKNMTGSSSNFSNTVTHNPETTVTETFTPAEDTAQQAKQAQPVSSSSASYYSRNSTPFWTPIEGSLYDWFEQNY